MAGPHPDPITESIERLERRSYTTYVCRLHAYRRLNRANSAWNSALIAFSTSTTIASIGLLVSRQMYGTGGDALLLALAVLSLVVSLVVSSVSYGTRARAMESNYKRVQQISLAAEDLRALPSANRENDYRTLLRDYEVAIDSSENHTEADYQAAMRQINPSASTKKRPIDLARDFGPYLTLFVPALLLVPFGFWFVGGLQL